MTDHPTALRRGDAIRTFVAVASSGAVVAAHLPALLAGKLANIDEGYAMALASRLLDGRDLYVGAVSQRGPLMYLAYEGAAGTFGWTSVGAVRLCALAVALATLAAVTLVARPRERLLALLGTGYALSLGFAPYDAVALNAELMMLPFLVAAAWLTMRAARRGVVWAVGAGILFGTATCFKQPAIVCVVPAALLVAARARALRPALARSVALLGGALAVPLGFVVHAALRGELAPFWYQTVTYNLTIHRAGAVAPMEWLLALGRVGQAPLLVLSLVGALAYACVRWRSIARRKRHAPPWAGLATDESFLALNALACVLAATSYRQAFGHYFLPAVPFLVLAAVRVTARIPPRFAITWTATAAAALCFAGSCVRMVESLATAQGRMAHGEAVETVARYVQRTTSPTSRIFVWGFSPAIYPYSHRRPATRFFFESYVTGFVPWLYEDAAFEPSRVVPGAMAELLVDLEREAPEVIVDAGSVQMPRSMRAYEPSARYLHERYCFDRRIGAFDVYRRKRGVCPTNCFPLVAAPVDAWDMPMGVKAADAVDWRAARWLGVASYGSSQSFPAGMVCPSWP